jgi:FimV-like protein
MARKKAEMQAPASGLARARETLERGNVRRAREILAEVAASGPESEREQARQLLERTGPDRVALLTIAGVFLVILIAAWVAILRH